MSGFRLEATDFMDFLNKFSDALEDKQKMADMIAEILFTNNLLRFDKEVDPDGTKWKKSLRAILEGGQTLQDTRRLRNSIETEASPIMVAIGTNVEYASVHQNGSEKKNIEQRTFVGISEEDIEEVKEEILDFWDRRTR